jgi:hypothetical protein
MNLDLGEVVLILLMGAYAVYLFQALRIRELALQTARRSCDREGVQLLDQSVSMQRMSLSRDAIGNWRVWRQYRFEYTVDGQERERGHVIMLGDRLQALVMAEHTLH